MPQQFNLEPIIPKKRITPSTKVILVKLTAALNHFAFAVISRQSLYPPKPARIKRIRTHTYGKRWTKRGPSLSGQDLVVVAGTNLSYAPYVGGFKTKPPYQTKATAQIGWASVEDSAQSEWRAIRPIVGKLAGG